MYSPFVRRLRLAREVRDLRERAELTHPELGKKIGRPRQQISRLETGRWIPKQAEMMKILDALGVEGESWTQLLDIARDAAEVGWWEQYKGMGDRQMRYADLESGAVTIREFQQTFPPGLLQTEDYQRARNASEATLQPIDFEPEQVIIGRGHRQRMLRRAGGPVYEVVLDELAVRRPTAPPPIMRAQLEHLVESVNGGSQITVRVLPATASIESYTMPRGGYSLYTYADPGDPLVAAVDTITSDLILTDADQVAPHDELYRRLRDATLPAADSLDLLAKAAAALPNE
jgi:transcriptional regulator with XRE-family HTH domain